MTPDKSGALSTDANNGYIDTTTQIPQGRAITITARDTITGRQFGEWQPIAPLMFSEDNNMPATVGTTDKHDIVAHYNDVVVAFAIYTEVKQTIVAHIPNVSIYNPWWWIETHGGLTPGPTPDPWASELVAALALASTAGNVSARLRARVLDLAVQQLSIVTAALKKEVRTLQKVK